MPDKVHLKIDGMHCLSCEMVIKAELAEVTGLSNIKIDSATGRGELEASPDVPDEAITQAIARAGYQGAISSHERPGEAPRRAVFL